MQAEAATEAVKASTSVERALAECKVQATHFKGVLQRAEAASRKATLELRRATEVAAATTKTAMDANILATTVAMKAAAHVESLWVGSGGETEAESKAMMATFASMEMTEAKVLLWNTSLWLFFFAITQIWIAGEARIECEMIVAILTSRRRSRPQPPHAAQQEMLF
jgi:hypothetical protein